VPGPKKPSFPVVSGEYPMTAEWTIALPGKFKRRIEDGSLVLWRPGLTAWIEVWRNDQRQSERQRLRQIRADSAPTRFDEIEEHENGLLRYAFRLAEPAEDARAAAVYCFAIGATGHVQMAVYFDQESEAEVALGMWRTVREHAAS
jgi:hypothetical protein